MDLNKWIGKGSNRLSPPEFLDNIWDVSQMLGDLADQKSDMAFIEVVKLLCDEWDFMLKTKRYMPGIIQKCNGRKRHHKLLVPVLNKYNKRFYNYMVTNLYDIVKSLTIYVDNNFEQFTQYKLFPLLIIIVNSLANSALTELDKWFFICP